jgi:ribosome-associated protein
MPKTKTTSKKAVKAAPKTVAKKKPAVKKTAVKKAPAKSAASKELDDVGLAKLCASLAEDKKAENIRVLDLRKLTAPCSFFVLCTGDSVPQLRAIANYIKAELKSQHKLSPYAFDGDAGSYWMAIDYGSVIIHIMDPEKYDHYQLHKLWADAAIIKK